MAQRFGVNRLTVLKAVRGLASAGVVETVPGKGVYVARQFPSGSSEPEAAKSADRFFEGVAEGPSLDDPAQLTDGIMETLRDALDQESISFSAGFPPPEAIPVAVIRRTLTRLLEGPLGASIIGYAPTEGTAALQRALVPLLERRGLQLGAADRIIVTGGCQQGIALCLQALLAPGEALALESPGYLGVIAACRLRRIPMIDVPVDDGGPHTGRLESVLRRNEVGAFYTVPSFQNPTGVSQGLRRRRRVVQLAARAGVRLIEDDIYADLRFGGRRPPPLKSLPGGRGVIYLGSFSKAFGPGLRVGFMVASEPFATELRRHKETLDISTGTLVQALMAELICSGAYRRHLVRVRRLYRERRDAMCAALERHLPAGVSFTRPRGGMHLWVIPSQTLDAAQLLERARGQGVTFAPGSLFFSDGRRSSCLRLNFSSHCPKRIDLGIGRLCDCLRKELST